MGAQRVAAGNTVLMGDLGVDTGELAAAVAQYAEQGKTAMYVAVDGALAGLAALVHPENFRAPQPVRVHPNEPFVCIAPERARRTPD